MVNGLVKVNGLGSTIGFRSGSSQVDSGQTGLGLVHMIEIAGFG